jgi:hypothetical protein
MDHVPTNGLAAKAAPDIEIAAAVVSVIRRKFIEGLPKVVKPSLIAFVAEYQSGLRTDRLWNLDHTSALCPGVRRGATANWRLKK